jgi:hypothetical protein
MEYQLLIEEIIAKEPFIPSSAIFLYWSVSNCSQGCKVRCTLNHLMVSVYWVPQMQGVGRADDLLYFKSPTTTQMRCPANAYELDI